MDPPTVVGQLLLKSSRDGMRITPQGCSNGEVSELGYFSTPCHLSLFEHLVVFQRQKRVSDTFTSIRLVCIAGVSVKGVWAEYPQGMLTALPQLDLVFKSRDSR